MIYNNQYYEKLINKENSEIGEKIFKIRCAFISNYPNINILDYGCGTGKIVKHMSSKGYKIKGYEVIQKTIDDLKKLKLYDDNIKKYDLILFYDSFEHIPNHEFLKQCKKNVKLNITIPIVHLNNIESSKHYRPDEHLHYFDVDSIKKYMWDIGYYFIEMNNYETAAGRDSIYTFIFKKI